MYRIGTKLNKRMSMIRLVVMLLTMGVVFGAANVDAKPKKNDGKKSKREIPNDGGKKVLREKKPGNKDGRNVGGSNKKMRRRHHAGRGGGNQQANIRPDVLNWILKNNPGLSANFLQTQPPDRQIKLPNGQTLPIYRLDQFLDVNFRYSYSSPDAAGKPIAKMMQMRLRKLLATPEFRDLVKNHRRQYQIAQRGKVSSGEAYNYIRNKNKHIAVKAGKQYKGTVGGGGGIAAPSYRMWKAMNLFWHESCHCIGIGHNSGGLSGPIAGKLKKMDKKKLWNYPTVDLNSLKVP